MRAQKPGRQERGDIPTLTPERDRMPARCSSCGSAALDRRPQMAGELVGSITCRACGTMLAFLRPALPPIPRGPSGRATESPPVPDWRRPWCGACVRRRMLPLSGFDRRPVWVEIHDPAAHERHVAALTVAVAALLAPRPAPPDATIRTGPLLLDLAAARCVVDGRDVAVSPLDLAILAHLSRRLGRACTVDEIVADVWPNDVARIGRKERRATSVGEHLLRTALTRLRNKLGPARALVVNRFGFGYLLAAAPYTGPSEAPSPPPVPAPAASAPACGWASFYPACVGCGVTDRPHKALGYCRRCYNRRRPPKGRPVGRPRKDDGS